MTCPGCGATVSLERPRVLVCPSCGAWFWRLRDGRWVPQSVCLDVGRVVAELLAVVPPAFLLPSIPQVGAAWTSG